MVSSAAMSGKIDSPYIVSLELKARKSLFTTSFSSFSSSTTFLIVFVPTQFSAASLQNSSPSSTTFRCFLKNVATGVLSRNSCLLLRNQNLHFSFPSSSPSWCRINPILPVFPVSQLPPPSLISFRFIVSYRKTSEWKQQNENGNKWILHGCTIYSLQIPFWNRLGPFRTFRNLSEPCRTFSNLSSLSKPFSTLQNLSEPFRTFSNLSKPFWTFRNLSEPLEPFRNFSELFRTFITFSTL